MFTHNENSARIEAALYSAGRPLTVDELVKASGTNSRDNTLKIISDLMEKTRTVFKALEIAHLEDGTFVFQLKSQYTPIIRKFANQPMVSGGALKTLSYALALSNTKKWEDLKFSRLVRNFKIILVYKMLTH